MVVLAAATRTLMTQIERSLAIAGYPVTHAADSTEDAVHWLQVDDPFGSVTATIIVLDEDLSDGRALDLCQRIKRTDRFLDTPLIVVGSGEEQAIREALESGASDYTLADAIEMDLPLRCRCAMLRAERIGRRRAGERRRLEELALARRLQHSVLSPPVSSSHIEISAAYIPSDELSGDMYYWSQIDEDRYGILLLDVMGHGLSSALISMALRSLMPDLITRFVDPVQVITELNRQMSLYQPTYLTALYVVINTRLGTLEWANAGHPPGLLLDGNQQVLALDRTTLPLGLEESPKVERRSLAYHRPARLLLYTDGLVEDRGYTIRAGIEHLKNCLRLYRLQSTAALVDVTILERRKILAAPDDICLIAVTLPATAPVDPVIT